MHVMEDTCRAQCGQFDHESKTCQNEIAFTNCDGKHFTYFEVRSRWKMEKRVQQVKDVEKNLFFTEARKIVQTSRPAATGKTYAAIVRGL